MSDVFCQSMFTPHTGFPIGTPTFSSHPVDANNDGVAYVFQALTTDPITHVGHRYGARTGTPPTYVHTLEGVSTSTGFPDGTDIGGGSPTAKTDTPPADATIDGLFRWIQLTNAYTPTLGQWLAYTVRYSSGTVDGSNNSTFTTEASNLIASTNYGDPFSLRLTAGTWAKRSSMPTLAIRTANNRYGFPLQSYYTTMTASTVGHRMAAKFTLPAGAGDTFTIRGFSATCNIAGAGGKAPIAGLWSAGGVLQNVTLDSDIVNSATGTNTYRSVLFDDAAVLTFGTTYYIGFEVADASSAALGIRGMQLNASGDLDAFPGGSNFHLATYNGSAWSDDQTVRPLLALIVGDITEPSGSSGGGYVIGG